MSTTGTTSTGFPDPSEDLHIYLCQTPYPRHINNVARTCKLLHHRLNLELWKRGTVTAVAKDDILYHAVSRGNRGLLQKLDDEYKLDFKHHRAQNAINAAAYNIFLCLAARKGDEEWTSELIRLGADFNKLQPMKHHTTNRCYGFASSKRQIGVQEVGSRLRRHSSGKSYS